MENSHVSESENQDDKICMELSVVSDIVKIEQGLRNLSIYFSADRDLKMTSYESIFPSIAHASLYVYTETKSQPQKITASVIILPDNYTSTFDRNQNEFATEIDIEKNDVFAKTYLPESQIRCNSCSDINKLVLSDIVNFEGSDLVTEFTLSKENYTLSNLYFLF